MEKGCAIVEVIDHPNIMMNEYAFSPNSKGNCSKQMYWHAVEVRLCWLYMAYFLPENEDIAGKSFAFPEKNNIPMYYVSASNGTNVVKVSYSVH